MLDTRQYDRDVTDVSLIFILLRYPRIDKPLALL